MRIAAVGDLHFKRAAKGTLGEMFARASQEADALVLAGDLTDFGLAEEGELLADELREHLAIPAIAVLGNHDFHSDQAEEIRKCLSAAHVVILDGDSVEIDGVGFAGAKGFAGGFGTGSLGPWGERLIKDFVQEAINEGMKLEAALTRLKAERRVVVLHYSPIEATVSGEPQMVFPYLGSSRLEEPLNKFPPTLVVHGHAHNGAARGATRRGVPVHNVSLPLLRKEGLLYRLLDV